MAIPKILLFTSLAVLISITGSLAIGSSSAVALTQSGTANGSLYTPSLVSIGVIDGDLLDTSGVAYQCVGTLEPELSSPLGWTGHSPTGTIEGSLTPMGPGPSVTGATFYGSYGLHPDGSGSFQAYVTVPSPFAGQPGIWIGNLSGRFRNSNTLDPFSLLPIPGDFIGKWNLSQ